MSQAAVEMVKELLKHRGDLDGVLRLFMDKGAYYGLLFRDLAAEARVRFYVPAVRYPANIKQWEQLQEADFEAQPFTFDKHADLPADRRPT